MRILLFIIAFLPLIANSQTVTQPGLREYQISGANLPDSILYILGTDTLDGSAKQGLGKFLTAESLRGWFKDTDWLKYLTGTVPNNTDTMYHVGFVTIGDDTIYGGKLNLLGRADFRYPLATSTNVAIGKNSGNLSATGLDGNMSIGENSGAGLANSTTSNVLMGFNSGATLVGSNQNTGIGGYTLDSIRSGANLNVAIGYGAIQKIRGTVSTQNIGIGYNALNTIKGNANLSNIAIGGSTMATLTGARNVAIGQGALTALVGSNNTVVGHEAFGSNTAGSGNVSIGYQSGKNETGSNKLYIENSSSTTPLIKGDFSADTLRINGALSIRDAVSGASTDSVLVWTPSNGRVKMRNASAFGGSGATDLSIAQSGATQVIQSSTGTDVGIRNLYGLLITEGATDTLHFRVDTSLLSTQYDITQIPISRLKAAIATNSIDNTTYKQEWKWDGIAGTDGLKLSSSTTAATGDLQKLLHVSLTNTNGTSGQDTWAGYFSNTHAGTTSTNYGLYGIATNGTSANYGVYGEANGANGQGVTGTSSGNIGVLGIGAIGVYGSATSGAGVYSTATSGIAVSANATSGTGVEAIVTSGIPISVQDNSAGTNTVEPMMQMYHLTSGTAAAGIGSSIVYNTEANDGSDYVSTTLTSKWTTATAGSRVSNFVVSGVTAAVEADILTMKGSGQMQLNKYVSGAFTGTAVNDLFIDASGNVIVGSMTGQSWTVDADDADTEVIGNQTLKFEGGVGIVTDYTSGTPDKVAFIVDGDEFTDVTTPEADDWVLMHDENGGGADVLQKILWSDLASLVGGGDGIYGGDGTTPSDVDAAVTDSLEFNGTLKIINDANDYVGIGAQTPEAKLHVRAANQAELIIEDTGETAQFQSKTQSGGVQPPLTITARNKDTHIDISGDYYTMGTMTFNKTSATVPGGNISFAVGYDSANVDQVLTVNSRESGATDGFLGVVGGLRYKWSTSASAAVTLTTGDYGLSQTFTGAKTCTLPDAVSGIVGQTFSVFNNASSGDITLTITGGSSDVFYGDVLVPINESVIVQCVAANKWIINN